MAMDEIAGKAVITLRDLAEKWHEVPVSRLERLSTRDLVTMTDENLLACWEAARAETSDDLRGLSLRGWYHILYAPWVSGKKILEVGPGIGIDGVIFASAGGSITFADISQTNLDVVSRIFALKSLRAPQCLHVQNFDDFDRLDCDYDAVFAFGSLHHMASDAARPEFAALARRLKPGGRFVMHAYPFSRWVNEGRMPFDTWGEVTDGPGMPWAEWYDAKKLIVALRPSRFAPIMYCEFRDGAMNCIDLVKIDGHPSLDVEPLPAQAVQVNDAVRLHELTADRSWAPSTATVDDRGVLVETAPQSWAYAASLPIHRELLPRGMARWFVKIEATVLHGRIGAAIATKAGASILTEEYLDADSDRASVLEFSGDEGALVIIRNASPTSTSSAVQIHSIELFGL
jgi:SAM-dependent methyltransferase